LVFEVSALSRYPYPLTKRRAVSVFLAAFLLAAPLRILAGETLRERAALLAASLDDSNLAAQTLLTGIDGKESLRDDTAALLRRIPAGGVMLFRYNLSVEKEKIAPFLIAVSDAILSGGGIPPFVAVDHEGGQVHRFAAGITRLPAPLDYWERSRSGNRMSGGKKRRAMLAKVEEDAFRSGEELRSLGITLNLAPVAETLSGGNKAFLDDRSYGPNSAFVTAACAAFIRGMERAGILCVVKHFPGNTGADPHSGKSVIEADRTDLARMTAPMLRLIESPHPPMLMMSHAVVPAWDGERSASLSKAVIGGLLREELGFSGVVLADDLTMGAVSPAQTPAEAAVAALNAGADMLMVWPPDINAIHRAILDALREGRLSRARLEDAAARIIYEKLRNGLLI
jgi:beta-N-acetylhexosaminidase